jgi:hypothetical protein
VFGSFWAVHVDHIGGSKLAEYSKKGFAKFGYGLRQVPVEGRPLTVQLVVLKGDGFFVSRRPEPVSFASGRIIFIIT